MKFSVNSKYLLKALIKCGGAISSNPVLPILESFKFHLLDETLTISATDLEVSITNNIEVTGTNQTGSVCVPGKILMDTLKELPSEPITFTVNDKCGIEIITSKGKYKLVGELAEDFPNIADIEDGTSITIESEQLLTGLQKTNFAQSNDDLRPAMCGTFCEFTPQGLTMVATDAHKLAKHSILFSCTVNETIILPKKATRQLTNLLESGVIGIKFNKTNVCFILGSIQLLCRVIDAKYPDYKAVIPTDNHKTAVFDKSDLSSSLKRVGLYANKTTNQVIMNLNGECILSAQDLSFNNEGREELACDYKGDEMVIGFNSKYMQESLSAFECERVKLSMSTPTRAGILTGDEDNTLVLLMPVMISN